MVVGVPVYGRLELASRALRSIDRHTPVEVALIVIDDCGPQPLTETALAGWLESGRPWRLVSHQQNQGFVGSANHLFQLAAGSDLILVNSDVEVLPGWFDGLAAAMAGDRLASASSLASVGGLLSVAELAGHAGRSQPELAGLLAEVRAAVPVAVPIPVAVAHCTWFSRAALDAVGDFDRIFDPGYAEEVDWSLRGARDGWLHRAALHSLVLHDGGASFGEPTGVWPRARRHELRVLARYPLRWWRIRRFAGNRNTELAVAICRIRRLLGAR